MQYKLQKPNFIKGGEYDLFKKSKDSVADIFEFINKTIAPKYLYWDNFQYKEPSPKDVSKEELWSFSKKIRSFQMIKTPIIDEKGNNFKWLKLPNIEEFFHAIDLNTGGELFSSKYAIDKTNKQKLISRGIMEEAIASSQLEGAESTRKVAKRFLREGRKPKNESEQMILNNYLTMKALEDDYKEREMNIDLLLELHGMITKDTLTCEGEKPHLRKGKDEVFVIDAISGKVYHKAPNADFAEKELKKLILFANDELKVDYFIHPIVKAIMIHFWLGYLHPFTDGNGRLARIIFYWYLLRKGYWAFAYLPISKIIKKSPTQYAMSYVYSEQDDNDLTYFIDYNIRKIKMAVNDFMDYLEKEKKKNLNMNIQARSKYNLNERQIKLLQYLYGAPDERTSLQMHMSIYQISNKPAINDLKDLEKQGFLISKKQGRNIYYYFSDKINKLF